MSLYRTTSQSVARKVEANYVTLVAMIAVSMALMVVKEWVISTERVSPLFLSTQSRKVRQGNCSSDATIFVLCGTTRSWIIRWVHEDFSLSLVGTVSLEANIRARIALRLA